MHYILLTLYAIYRERNKVLARKTRVKKKVELEYLRDRATELHNENETLKQLIHSRLPPPLSANILMQCDLQLPNNVSEVVNDLISKITISSHSILKDKLSSLQKIFCITNVAAYDNPIVYASPGFVELTGYPLSEIIGRNCRFLQGPETDKNMVCNMYIVYVLVYMYMLLVYMYCVLTYITLHVHVSMY